MNPAQIEFLALHIRRTVFEWRWRMCETQLRASTVKRTATISRQGLEELFGAGLMEQGAGVSVRVTAAGREWLAAHESAEVVT